MSLLAKDFHQGEIHLHQQLKVPEDLDNPTAPGHSLRYFATLLSQVPLFAIGTLDHQNRPWSTLWGGSPGLPQPLGRDILGVKATVDHKFDPVVQALFDGVVEDGKVVKAGAEGRKMVSALAVDLEGRKRVKLFGRMVVCAVGAEKMEKDEEGEDEEASELEKNMTVQLVVQLEQVLGNCPKYINKKVLRPAKPTPKLVSEGSILSQEALDLISEADTFFMSSSNADQDMDTNHRGGPPGFVRVRYDSSSSSHELVYPEYSGNRLYQTLGNLHTTPYAGLVIPNFTTGDVLFITGTTSIHIGADAAALLPRSNLVVKIRILDHKYIKRGLPFLASNATSADSGRSPYNPRVRLLPDEAPTKSTLRTNDIQQTATLLSQTPITPTISHFSFSLGNPSPTSTKTWKAGQYITLDFSSELDQGYSHMRDDDPRSINDDFVRSFTISSPPPRLTDQSKGSTFTLTLRRIANGPVTSHLFRHGLKSARTTTAPLEIPILGFSGSFGFDIPRARKIKDDDKQAKLVYICSGVGVTPLLAQIDELEGADLIGRLSVFWTVNVVDVGFVVDTLMRMDVIGRMGGEVRVFVTGMDGGVSTLTKEGGGGDVQEALRELEGYDDIQVLRRRFREDDFATISSRQQSQEQGEAKAETDTALEPASQPPPHQKQPKHQQQQPQHQKHQHQLLICANPKLTALLRSWLHKLNIEEITSENFAY